MTAGTLNFDYELIQGQVLKAALGRAPLAMDDLTVSFENIVLLYDNMCLLFKVDDDTDEIICNNSSSGIDSYSVRQLWFDVDALKGYLGSSMGWIWQGKNWLGYYDMITLAFNNIEPAILLVGGASRLNVYYVQRAVG